jgi:hypothetical protein
MLSLSLSSIEKEEEDRESKATREAAQEPWTKTLREELNALLIGPRPLTGLHPTCMDTI